MQTEKLPYKNLTDTLKLLKKQVKDSLPYISSYIPLSLTSPEELFYFLRDKVKYKKDPQGVELLQTVQTLMDKGGRGDCDCFTILTLASCHYLGFSPQEVALVGKTKYAPSHIYSMVYDESKNKMCAMDLTNPYYCMERSYKFKQTLPFNMYIQLQDNSFSGMLASKATRKAKKSAKTQIKIARQTAKVAKKTAKINARVAKKENKATRKVLRTDRRTDRVEKKGVRKMIKRDTKVQRKQNKLTRSTGREEIIKARQEKNLNRIKSISPGSSEYEPGQEDEFNSASSPTFNPESDQVPEYDEQINPGSEWQASDTQDVDYELMPDEEDEFSVPFPNEEEEEQEMQDGFIFQAVKGIKNLITKGQDKVSQVRGSKIGTTIQKGASQYNEIVALKRNNVMLKSELERESKNKYIYGGTGTALGLATGILIGRATKR